MPTVKIDRSKEWTVDDYVKLGEMNTPCQLVNGELIISPSPSPLHQRISRKLFRIIDDSIQSGEAFYAPFDVYIDRKNVFQPDIFYVNEEATANISGRGLEGAPTLVVEIISLSNIFTDRNIKKRKYLECGVKEYWILDPANKTLEIYHQNQKDPDTPDLYLVNEGIVTSTVLTTLNFDLKTIF